MSVSQSIFYVLIGNKSQIYSFLDSLVPHLDLTAICFLRLSVRLYRTGMSPVLPMTTVRYVASPVLMAGNTTTGGTIAVRGRGVSLCGRQVWARDERNREIQKMRHECKVYYTWLQQCLNNYRQINTYTASITYHIKMLYS